MEAFSHLRIDGFSDCHVQGIAVDEKREYMYFSFTTSLIKTDMKGNIKGSVKGIAGHLGCLAYNPADGKVYGSLEYKNDSIGKGILASASYDFSFDDRFYIVSFDVGKIKDRDMDALNDGIMTAVFLKDVCDDYNYPGHRYGCSGIDGITFAPPPGKREGLSLYVAYGIYGDKKRKDNDHQILLRYNIDELNKYALSLDQNNLHINGPQKACDKYFVYTGNTTYGIQNLEYDKENNCLFAAVYKGRKLRFPNYRMYAVDISVPSCKNNLKGIGEQGSILELKKFPFFYKRGKICGCNFPFGSTGMISLGNGNYLFSEEFRENNKNGTDVYSYRLDLNKGFIKEEIFL